jgi:hypothetical protein
VKFYLCANRHHFAARTPRCPSPGCTAEVRSTAADPLSGDVPAFERLPRLEGAEEPAPAPPAADVKHSTRWWAYEDGNRVRRRSDMRDGDYRWDATCACGWDSGTGGAAMGDVDKMVQEHKR